MVNSQEALGAVMSEEGAQKFHQVGCTNEFTEVPTRCIQKRRETKRKQKIGETICLDRMVMFIVVSIIKKEEKRNLPSLVFTRFYI